MASKQLGKLRQWAGEKIASEKKTIATEEFKDLEMEVERRRIGMEQVYFFSQAYHKYLCKKKEVGENEEKLLPMESLGRIMVSHGQEFGPDSAYGHALCTLGEAHVKVASYQEQFSESFSRDFLARVATSLAEVKEYHALRKKLKSRRLAYDAAVHQAQKQFKKEKEKAEAEEEVVKARARFDEMSIEVQNQMERIQDGEMDQFKDLGRLLDMELKFAEQWVETLRSVKNDWPADSEVHRVVPSRPRGPTHIMQDVTPTQQNFAQHEIDNEDDVNYHKEDSDDSESDKPPRHKRTLSTASSQGRKSSVSNWASVAVGSFRRKEKNANFEALEGDDDADSSSQTKTDASVTAPSLVRSRSGKAAPPPPRPRAQSGISEPPSSKHSSPRLPIRKLESTEKLRSQKVMRVLYTFNGDEDELSMEVGDEIAVLAEPSDTWWLGECRGRKGLFPVNYTEEMPRKPPLPARPSLLGKGSGSHPATPVLAPVTVRSRSNSAHANANTHTNKAAAIDSDWRDEPFGDHYSTLDTIAPSPSFRDLTHSDDDNDHDDERGLIRGVSRSRSQSQPQSRDQSTTRSVGGGGSGVDRGSPPKPPRQLARSLSNKRAPPPPPPARKNATTHRPGSSRGNSADASPFLNPTNPTNTKWSTSTSVPNPGLSSTSSSTKIEHHRSPFDEGEDPMDNLDHGSLNSFSLSHKCPVCNCDDFQQNLFKSDGYCNSCFHSHST